jgi:hypothetical protein
MPWYVPSDYVDVPVCRINLRINNITTYFNLCLRNKYYASSLYDNEYFSKSDKNVNKLLVKPLFLICSCCML